MSSQWQMCAHDMRGGNYIWSSIKIHIRPRQKACTTRSERRKKKCKSLRVGGKVFLSQNDFLKILLCVLRLRDEEGKNVKTIFMAPNVQPFLDGGIYVFSSRSFPLPFPMKMAKKCDLK